MPQVLPEVFVEFDPELTASIAKESSFFLFLVKAPLTFFNWVKDLAISAKPGMHLL